MSSREKILSALRGAGMSQVEHPVRQFAPITYSDRYGRLLQALREAACEVEELTDKESVDDVILKHFPQAGPIASSLKEVGCATVDPDALKDPHELQGIDIAVVRGAFAVLENGMIWVPRTMRHRTLCFIPETLVILLDPACTVDNMHEAVSRQDFVDGFDFGCFIAGPSKTADIEQALVIGAHGPRRVLVVLTS